MHIPLQGLTVSVPMNVSGAVAEQRLYTGGHLADDHYSSFAPENFRLDLFEAVVGDWHL